ncbi:MAG TPA: hypothetical protein VMH91_03205 [Candidatus Paceibacterota bacterium]|nr:hypothetical protein [Candidatus Paceibacterota bacterium]
MVGVALGSLREHSFEIGVILGALAFGMMILIVPILLVGEPLTGTLSLRQELVGIFSAMVGTMTVITISLSILCSRPDTGSNPPRGRKPPPAVSFCLLEV